MAFTDPPRKPSKTKITTLRGMPPVGCVCSEKKVEDTGQAAIAATSRTKIFFIGIPQNRNSKYRQRNSQASMQWVRWRRRPAGSLLFPGVQHRRQDAGATLVPRERLQRRRLACRNSFLCRVSHHV